MSIPPPTIAFTTIGQARLAMEILADCFMSAPLPSISCHPTFVQRLEAWTLAFESYQRIYNIDDFPEERRSRAMLEAQKRYFEASLFYFTSGSSNAMHWDTQLALFKETLHHARVAVDTGAKGSEAVFTLDMGIIPPVFSVVMRCRDPVVRRHAIDILRRNTRQEAVWKSTLVARVAQRVVELEEEGLGVVNTCDDVPLKARLAGVQVSMDPTKQRAQIHYLKGSSAYRTETMTWSGRDCTIA